MYVTAGKYRIERDLLPQRPNLSVCSSNTPVGNLSDFYCPDTTQRFSAKTEGQNGASKSTSFSVASAEDLFTNSPADAVFPALGGVNPTGYGFDWGLPIFPE